MTSAVLDSLGTKLPNFATVGIYGVWWHISATTYHINSVCQFVRSLCRFFRILISGLYGGIFLPSLVISLCRLVGSSVIYVDFSDHYVDLSERKYRY